MQLKIGGYYLTRGSGSEPVWIVGPLESSTSAWRDQDFLFNCPAFSCMGWRIDGTYAFDRSPDSWDLIAEVWEGYPDISAHPRYRGPFEAGDEVTFSKGYGGAMTAGRRYTVGGRFHKAGDTQDANISIDDRGSPNGFNTKIYGAALAWPANLLTVGINPPSAEGNSEQTIMSTGRQMGKTAKNIREKAQALVDTVNAGVAAAKEIHRNPDIKALIDYQYRSGAIRPLKDAFTDEGKLRLRPEAPPWPANLSILGREIKYDAETKAIVVDMPGRSRFTADTMLKALRHLMQLGGVCKDFSDYHLVAGRHGISLPCGDVVPWAEADALLAALTTALGSEKEAA